MGAATGGLTHQARCASWPAGHCWVWCQQPRLCRPRFPQMYIAGFYLTSGSPSRLASSPSWHINAHAGRGQPQWEPGGCLTLRDPLQDTLLVHLPTHTPPPQTDHSIGSGRGFCLGPGLKAFAGHLKLNLKFSSSKNALRPMTLCSGGSGQDTDAGTLGQRQRGCLAGNKYWPPGKAE